MSGRVNKVPANMDYKPTSIVSCNMAFSTIIYRYLPKNNQNEVNNKNSSIAMLV